MPTHRERLLDNLEKLATNDTTNCPKNSMHMYLCLIFERWSTLDIISNPLWIHKCIQLNARDGQWWFYLILQLLVQSGDDF